MGQAVDSSAIISTSGWRSLTASFNRRRNDMACRFSRPPNSLGTHSPGARE